MIPREKVQDIITRHDLLEKELSSGSLDPKLFAEKLTYQTKKYRIHLFT